MTDREREARIRDGEVLDRETFERKAKSLQLSIVEILDTYAALRERVERLERIVRHTLCDCGPSDNPDLTEHADYCRARNYLEDADG